MRKIKIKLKKKWIGFIVLVILISVIGVNINNSNEKNKNVIELIRLISPLIKEIGYKKTDFGKYSPTTISCPSLAISLLHSFNNSIF